MTDSVANQRGADAVSPVIKVLVVDDDERLRRLCAGFLKRIGHESVCVEGGDQALREIQRQHVDLLLTDYKMPGMTGDVLIERMHAVRPDIIPIIMTAFPSMELAIDAVRKGAYEFLTKPFEFKGFQEAIERALERRSEEKRRYQTEILERLVEMENRLGDRFELPHTLDEILAAVETSTTLETSTTSGSPASVPVSDHIEAAAPLTGSAKRSEDGLVAIVCEPIPADRNLLKTDPAYHHFRTIHAVLRNLNEQVVMAGLDDAVKIVMAAKSTDIPKYFRLYADQICCIIFGPNFPTLTEVAVRVMANSIRNRRVVVCHNPVNADFSWDRLTELGTDFGIIGYRSSMDETGARNFWSMFFLEELKPLVEERLAAAREGSTERTVPTTDEVRGLLANDFATLDLLPAFPSICRDVIEGIESGASFPELEEIMKADGALQASIIKTANQTRFGAKVEVETLAVALSVIGLEETRKIAAAKAMRDLASQVDQEGFELGDFLRHCAGTGFLAQMLSLDPESEEPREKELRRTLGLRPFICSTLRAAGLWKRFEFEDGFDAFTGGLLHDIGKIFNVSCYRGIYPLIQYEIEQSRWQGSLLDSEGVVVWDFQHPGTGSALLAEWEMFPQFVDAIHNHHRIGQDSHPAAVLMALANCLVKGMYAFPVRIQISDEFRKNHLEAVADAEVRDNPLPNLFQTRVELFGLELDRLLLSSEELESGEYAPEKVEGMMALARSTFENHHTYVDWLVRQNPEFLPVSEWLGAEPDELLALSLVLREPLTDLVASHLRD